MKPVHWIFLYAVAGLFVGCAANVASEEKARPHSDAITDDGNAGTIDERTVTPAEQARCEEAPPNDATCQGIKSSNKPQ